MTEWICSKTRGPPKRSKPTGALNRRRRNESNNTTADNTIAAVFAHCQQRANTAAPDLFHLVGSDFWGRACGKIPLGTSPLFSLNIAKKSLIAMVSDTKHVYKFNVLQLLSLKARESRTITCVGTVRVSQICQNPVCVVPSLPAFLSLNARAGPTPAAREVCVHAIEQGAYAVQLARPIVGGLLLLLIAI